LKFEKEITRSVSKVVVLILYLVRYDIPNATPVTFTDIRENN